MLPIKVKDIVEATEGVLLHGDPETDITCISTDTRKLKKGDFFVPILGENFDGHDFINQALELGACGYLTHRDDRIILKGIVIKVKDSLKAYQAIAELYRAKFDIPIIGVTGSSGKTTTKDMIYEVLARKYKVLRTEGNLNNQIGVPMTLLNLSTEHQIGVIEMGMNSLGEISVLSKIARPCVSVITNIGLAHIGKLGSRQNILKAKMEILDGMDENGVVILNGDDSLLLGLKNLLKFKTIYFGLQEGLDIQAYNIRVIDEINISFDIQINGQKYFVLVPLPGIHNVYNALAAIAVGIEFKVPMEYIIEGIRNYKPSKRRMNILLLSRKIKLIDDVYNANPNSMEEALKVMKNLSGNRKIAVLGDMLELGEWTRQAHMNIGESVVKNEINYLITLGENSKHIAEGAVRLGMSQRKIKTCLTIDEVNQTLKDLIRDGDVILVKGSRGMKMEGIVEFIYNLYSA